MDLQQSFMPLLIALGWMSGMLLIGTFIRAKVAIFQKYLFPASLIGGILGFILISAGAVRVPHEAFALIGFHLFSLGFVSIGLTGSGGIKGVGKTVLKGSLWMALIWTASLSIQSIIGFGALFGLNKITTPVFEGLGFLAGHGFTQGPGQTVAIAAIWENAFKIPDAVSVGLTFAAAGFFVAAFVGVTIANWGVRKGFATNTPKDLPEAFLKGILKKGSNESAGNLTVHPANIDTFAFQLALLFGTYFLAYILCYFLNAYVFTGNLAKLTFGFIFIYGLILAIIVRVIIDKLGIGHLVDSNIQRRISGSTVDYMIVAVLMAVEITVLLKYIVPILLIIFLVTTISVFYILYFGRRTKAYAFERTVAMFGYCTGTAASGLLLLRIVDPEFKTPVAMEIGFMNLWAILTATHILMLVGTVPSPDTLSVAAMAGVHALTAVVLIIFLKVFRLSGNKVY